MEEGGLDGGVALRSTLAVGRACGMAHAVMVCVRFGDAKKCDMCVWLVADVFVHPRRATIHLRAVIEEV